MIKDTLFISEPCGTNEGSAPEWRDYLVISPLWSFKRSWLYCGHATREDSPKTFLPKNCVTLKFNFSKWWVKLWEPNLPCPNPRPPENLWRLIPEDPFSKPTYYSKPWHITNVSEFWQLQWGWDGIFAEFLDESCSNFSVRHVKHISLCHKMALSFRSNNNHNCNKGFHCTYTVIPGPISEET